MDKNISKESRKISDNHKIIHKFLLPSDVKDKYYFARECTIAKKLINKYGLDFLLWSPLPFGEKLQSLKFFLTQDGENYLLSFQLEYKKQTIDLSPVNKTIVLDKEKIGDDIIIKKEPKTLLEFLNKYK